MTHTPVRNRLFLAALLAAVCAPASAQSSVTLFGVVDLSLRWVDNDASQYQMASGGLQTSRLGFRGTESLGDGWSVGFWLEGELTPDNGNEDGFFFRRRSTVSLVSQSLGELRFGRDKVPTYYTWETYDPFADAGVGRSTRLSQAAGLVPKEGTYSTFSRANNLSQYFLPGNLGGLFGQASYALGEGQLGNKYAGALIGWRADKFQVSGAYGVTEVTFDDNATNWNIGASYDFGVAKLSAFYASLEIADASQGNWLVGVAVPVGALVLKAAYQSMDGGGALSNQSAWQMAIGGVYSLSKRTALYATYSYIGNNNATRFTVASGAPLTLGNNSQGAEFGIRHLF
jgi:predicted porin